MSVAMANDQVDQCLSLPGPHSLGVSAMTSSSCSSVIARIAPSRGASARSFSPPRRNRDRHLRTYPA